MIYCHKIHVMLKVCGRFQSTNFDKIHTFGYNYKKVILWLLIRWVTHFGLKREWYNEDVHSFLCYYVNMQGHSPLIFCEIYVHLQFSNLLNDFYINLHKCLFNQDNVKNIGSVHFVSRSQSTNFVKNIYFGQLLLVIH